MNNIRSFYKKLLKKHGPQGWWPLSGIPKPIQHNDKDFYSYRKSFPTGSQENFLRHWPRHLGKKAKTEQQKFEIMVGAILTQNTSWHNVEKVLFQLNKHALVSIEKILMIKRKRLAALIRSSGYFNQKAERLKILVHFLQKERIKKLRKMKTRWLREKLLTLKGIGPETADAILLYAFDRPLFVVDAYTKRLCSCLGFCKESDSYEDIQLFFHQNLPKNIKLFQEYHALIVAEGKSKIYKL